ncbi:diguanylate cyclase [Alkalimonas sp. NCh-2]|uniref:diguanylate cyclase domain-containing protein n=1 Tax=Alkalimonas sp. NCh-2 TaxID=3144846 RepID=UPI0031F6B91A
MIPVAVVRSQHSRVQSPPEFQADLDNFNPFNDGNGHKAGDLVLQDVAKCWQASIGISSYPSNGQG